MNTIYHVDWQHGETVKYNTTTAQTLTLIAQYSRPDTWVIVKTVKY